MTKRTRRKTDAALKANRLAGAAGAGDGGKRAFSGAASSPVFGFGANQAVAIG